MPLVDRGISAGVNEGSLKMLRPHVLFFTVQERFSQEQTFLLLNAVNLLQVINLPTISCKFTGFNCLLK